MMMYAPFVVVEFVETKNNLPFPLFPSPHHLVPVDDNFLVV